MCSRTPVTRILKGNEKQFELAGGLSYWVRLNIQLAMFIIDSWGKNLVHNLQYGPRTWLVKGMYNVLKLERRASITDLS